MRINAKDYLNLHKKRQEKSKNTVNYLNFLIVKKIKNYFYEVIPIKN